MVDRKYNLSDREPLKKVIEGTTYYAYTLTDVYKPKSYEEKLEAALLSPDKTKTLIDYLEPTVDRLHAKSLKGKLEGKTDQSISHEEAKESLENSVNALLKKYGIVAEIGNGMVRFLIAAHYPEDADKDIIKFLGEFHSMFYGPDEDLPFTIERAPY